MVSGRAASWHAAAPLVATLTEALFRNPLPHSLGADEQAQPGASSEISSQYLLAYAPGSRAALSRGEDRIGAFSSLFEVVHRHRFPHGPLDCLKGYAFRLVHRRDPGLVVGLTGRAVCSHLVDRSSWAIQNKNTLSIGRGHEVGRRRLAQHHTL